MSYYKIFLSITIIELINKLHFYSFYINSAKNTHSYVNMAATNIKTPAPSSFLKANISKSVYGYDMRWPVGEAVNEYDKSGNILSFYNELYYKKNFLDFLYTPLSRIIIQSNYIENNIAPSNFQVYNKYKYKYEQLYWDTIVPKKYTNQAQEIFAREYENFISEKPWD